MDVAHFIHLFNQYLEKSNYSSMAPTQKSVLVTGCSAGGIGEALAAEFQEKGWLTFATARNLKKVQHLEDTGCKVLELDVTNEETIKNAVKEVELRTGGKLDMLINNAGMSTLLPSLAAIFSF